MRWEAFWQKQYEDDVGGWWQIKHIITNLDHIKLYQYQYDINTQIIVNIDININMRMLMLMANEACGAKENETRLDGQYIVVALDKQAIKASTLIMILKMMIFYKAQQCSHFYDFSALNIVMQHYRSFGLFYSATTL